MMTKTGTRRFTSLSARPLAILLLAACSSAGSGEGNEAEPGAENGDGLAPTLPGAPSSPSPPGSPTLPNTPSASPGGNPAAPSSGLDTGAPPTALDPGTSPPASNGSSSGGGVGEPSDPPPPDSSGLIRGDAPTTESATGAGPFDVETLSAGLRDGPDYGTQTLHVPVDAEPPFAGVVVVPGFISPESSIRAWGPFLASHGIVTLTIGTNSGGDPPEVRARALLDGITTLKAENERSGSPLEGAMALDRFGVMGWSMGGGGTLIVANEHPELRAAVGLAAWSPGVRFADNEVPTLLLAGSADGLAGGQSQGFFESIPEQTPKMLFEVAGGPHDIANNPASAGGEIGRYGLSWLKVFLEGDERYRQFLLETPSRESDFRDNL
jgi:dienelactone hydrolase